MKLTVAIPSFNGQEHLSECIDSIMLSISNTQEPNSVDIQLFINGSTDESYELVKSKYGHLKNFRVSHFSENLGYDRNLLRLLKSVVSDYVWLLGDDDVVSANSISEILQVLSKSSPACIVLRPVMFEKFIPFSDSISNFLEIYDSSSFFHKLLWLGSALSSNVWKTQNLQLTDKEKYLGTNWIHVPLLMDNSMNFISEQSPGVIFDEGLVFVRHGNLRWEQNFGNWYATGLTHLLVIKEVIYAQAPELFQLYANDRFRTKRRDLSLALSFSNFAFRFRLATLSSKLFHSRLEYWFIDLPFLLMTRHQRNIITLIYMKIFRR